MAYVHIRASLKEKAKWRLVEVAKNSHGDDRNQKSRAAQNWIRCVEQGRKQMTTMTTTKKKNYGD